MYYTNFQFANTEKRESFSLMRVKPRQRIIFFLDTDECLESPCDVNAKCTNTNGSYECTCRGGFSGDGKNCSGKFLVISKSSHQIEIRYLNSNKGLGSKTLSLFNK